MSLFLKLVVSSLSLYFFFYNVKSKIYHYPHTSLLFFFYQSKYTFLKILLFILILAFILNQKKNNEAAKTMQIKFIKLSFGLLFFSFLQWFIKKNFNSFSFTFSFPISNHYSIVIVVEC